MAGRSPAITNASVPTAKVASASGSNGPTGGRIPSVLARWSQRDSILSPACWDRLNSTPWSTVQCA
jgi:hypothetical protein